MANPIALSWRRGEQISRTDTIHEAAELGNIDKLERHSQRGIDNGYPERVTLQTRDDVLGAMPIHFAAEHGHAHILEYLINHQVDLDAGDNNLVTALHLAAIRNHIGIVQCLLRNGAQPNIVDRDGDTPLHWAATKGNVAVMEVLVNYRNMDQTNNQGWTPLHRASFNARIPACEMLLKRGASLQSVNQEGNSALHLACLANQLKTVEYLMSWEPNVGLPNHEGKVAAELCGLHYKDAVVELLSSIETARKQPGSVRQVTRKLLARTSIAPEKSPTKGGLSPRRRRMTDPVPLPPLSPETELSRQLSLGNYSSYAKKDAQGFPLILEGAEIQIRPVSRESEFMSYVEASRRSSYASGRASSNDGDTDGGSLKQESRGAEEARSQVADDLNANDMSPWDSEEDAETTTDTGEHERSSIKQQHRSVSLGSARRRTSLNKKFLEKYNLQKHYLFGPS